MTDSELTIQSYQKNDEVVITVADNGKGIPDHELKQIFEPFFTTKAAGEGTGLGLAISSQIMHKHGGRIEVSSAVGTGTVFYLYFPAAVKTNGKHPTHHAKQHSQPKKPRAKLFVDA